MTTQTFLPGCDYCGGVHAADRTAECRERMLTRIVALIEKRNAAYERGFADAVAKAADVVNDLVPPDVAEASLVCNVARQAKRDVLIAARQLVRRMRTEVNHGERTVAKSIGGQGASTPAHEAAP